MTGRGPRSQGADRDLGRLGALALAGFGAALLFTAAPGLDLWVSGWFADSEAGFRWARAAPLEASHRFVNQLGTALVLFLLFALGWTFWSGRRLLRLGRKAYVYLALVLALGPGLLVNGILKAHWGRARPRDVEQFGGEAAFSAALEPSGACPGNCSFVSGDVALAASLTAFACVVGAAAPIWARIALAFTAWIAFVRLAQGAHFLSDVLFAAIFTLLIVLGLKRIVLDGDGGIAEAARRRCEPGLKSLAQWREAHGRPALLGVGVLVRDALRGPEARLRAGARRLGLLRAGNTKPSKEFLRKPVRTWRDWVWFAFLSSPSDFGLEDDRKDAALRDPSTVERDPEGPPALKPSQDTSPETAEERRDEILRRRQRALDSRLRRKA